MTVGILTEKPSAARNFAKALGGQSGTCNGESYVIAFARGHLFELKQPVDQVDPSKRAKYASWSLSELPWDVNDFAFEREKKKDTSKLLADIKKALGSCDELAIATDSDVSGEGGLLAWEIISELGLDHKPISRMYFTDESPASIKKAFVSRKRLTSMEDHDEYRMAWLRSRWDFLSMQWTRIASELVDKRAIVRQGRLKSAMIVLVGDQLKAHNEWKKVPFYESRFRDENGVMYIDPDAQRFAHESDVDLSGLHASSVTVDSKTMKRSGPPRMLDLAGLSALLSAKGVKAAEVLKIYQKMYESQVVSYPRTDDKHVTKEQFAELVRNAPAIARAVGIDPSLLTHTAARSTHVKDSGAHGANRPGPNIPSSLAEVENKYGKVGAMIYELLARSALAVLAEDYEYEAQKGHVTDFPAYVGSCSVPKKQGWKAVLGDASMADDDDDENDVTGLGTKAQPFVHEGVPSQPVAPTVKWLMKQLERRDVGTGATRTSTFAEVSSSKARYPLMDETKGRISLTETGEISYRLLPGTHIGDLSITERVFSDMKAVAKGEKQADDVLAEVARLVTDDIAVMTANAQTMRKDLGMGDYVEKEYFEGTWDKTGAHVRFNRTWSGHRFTDQECMDLLAGKDIEITATSKRTGDDFTVIGSFGEYEFEGRKCIGFIPDFTKPTSAAKRGVAPKSMLGVKLTDEQREKIEAGEKVLVKGMKSKKSGKNFDAYLFLEDKPDGTRGIAFSFDA
jgi:DNA topoisomerase-3|nr:MAG TPA: Topoisomerase IA [Herelleviridae sp.]